MRFTAQAEKAFHQYMADQAELNQVTYIAGSPKLTFAATPSVEQRLIQVLLEKDDFLTMINQTLVGEIAGEALGISPSQTMAARTDTTSVDRATKVVADINSIDTYTCKKTEFDSHTTYAALDSWARYPDFQARLTDVNMKRLALDRIMIGFNGTSAAVSTDRTANPLLQDVNIGWLQKIRAQPLRYKLGAIVGSGGDYGNVDALVIDAINNLIDPWYRKSPDLIVLASRDVINAKYFGIINKSVDNINLIAGNTMISDRPTLGGCPAIDVPYLPDGTILITTLKNLSIYTQEGSMRKTIVDNPRRDRIETYMTMNDAYVIEDFGATALVEAILPTL